MFNELNVVGIIGAGAMGRGIAQVCATAGCTVQLFDVAQNAAAQAIRSIEDDLRQAVAKGKLSEDELESTLTRIVAISEIGALSACDLIVEAIIEQLEPKQRLFQELEKVVGASCVLATNTSSLSVTAIASGCATPERVAGWHFFNPVPRMRVVEVVRAPRTDAHVVEQLVELSQRLGHRAIVAEDSPGFVVNHAGRAFVTEGLKMLNERVADHETLDAILRTAAGFRMGPFELLDLTGLDVSVPVMESIHTQYYGDDRYRPVPLGRTRLTAGLLGRKTGHGFYRYGGERQVAPAPELLTQDSPVPSVWWPVDGPAALPHCIVTLLEKGRRVDLPQHADVVFVAPRGKDLSSTVVQLGLDPNRAVAVDALFGSASGMTVMVSPATSPAALNAARVVLAAREIPAFVIADSPGLVAPRVVACIVNLACEIAQQGIAGPADIDAAVRLGLGYPFGPFEWGDKLGASRVLGILEDLFATFGDQRYRPSPWLVRRAQLGLSLTSPDRRA